VYKSLAIKRKRVVGDGLAQQAQSEKMAILAFANKSGIGTVVDLEKLIEEVSDERFVERSYRKILGRTADISGREHYLDMLVSKRMTKFDVLAALMASEEAKSRNLFVL